MLSIAYNMKKVKQYMLVDRTRSFGYSKENLRQGEQIFPDER